MPPGRAPGSVAADQQKKKRKRLVSRTDAARDQRTEGGGNRPRQTKETGGTGQPGSPNRTESVPALIGQDNLTPNSEFGKSFNAASYPDLLANPDVLATKWMGENGITPQNAGGMQKVYNDLAAVIPQLFYLTQGGAGLESGSLPAFLDYAQSFLNQYSTPGAGVVSPNAISNLFGSGENSPINALINNPNLDSAGQAQTVMGLIGSGLATSMPGGVASSIMGQAEQLAREWMAQQASAGPGGTQAFTDFLASKGFTDYFR